MVVAVYLPTGEAGPSKGEEGHVFTGLFSVLDFKHL